ncbi:MAG: acetyl-CoA C-acetyltransferase [Tatlockia sp.]|nr:acetyl-CoA C-acetyltransferase [Tatlockia sp.]
MKTRPVYIAGGIRTPFVKSMTSYSQLTTLELMTVTMSQLTQKMNLQGRIVGDVGLGAVMLSPSDWGLARECVLGSGLNPHTPGYTVQRACGTSLETTLQIALKIANYQVDDGIAAGVDTNSDIPIMFRRSFARKLLALNRAKEFKEKMKIFFTFGPKDLKPVFPAVVEPRTGLSMGEHTEKMVKEWKISRDAQDKLALLSHQNTVKAYDEGFYEDLVFELMGVKQDGIMRKDATLEKLASLKPAFDRSGKGTLTAGNSTPLSDGAAAVYLLSEEQAQKYQHPMLARFVDAQVAAVDYVHGEGLLMGPTIAVSKLLERNNLNLQDFEFYEIHEAFAGQVLCTLKAWESEEYCKRVLNRPTALGAIDQSKMNVKGGSVAIGHPFAATGARIVASLAKMLKEKGKGRGLISICTAGGMGVAAILEAV